MTFSRGGTRPPSLSIDQQVLQGAVEQAVHYDDIKVVQVALPVWAALFCLEVLPILDMEREKRTLTLVGHG